MADLPLKGQSARLYDLIESFMAGRFAVGFLISGPFGSGKRTLAQYLARAALCQTRSACGACASCKRALSGNHPDLITVSTDKRSIGVDEARGLIASLAEKPFEGGMRAVIIEEADKLTPQAQNALLKTLEEHAAQTLFFLLTAKPGDMLLTVRSRLSPVRMALLGEDEVCGILMERGIDASRAADAARQSGGSVGQALACAHDERLNDLRAASQDALLSAREPAALPGILARFKGMREDAEGVLDAVEALLGEAARAHGGFGASALAQAFTYERIDAMMGACVLARKRIKSNVAFVSAMEGILVQAAR